MTFYIKNFKPKPWHTLLALLPVPYYSERAAFNLSYHSLLEQKSKPGNLEEKVKEQLSKRAAKETAVFRFGIYGFYIGVAYLLSRML